MAAISTVGGSCSLGFKVNIADRSPLPRVLNTVGEVSVATYTIEATLTNLSLVGLWKTLHAETFKDTFAHPGPEIVLKVG